VSRDVPARDGGEGRDQDRGPERPEPLNSSGGLGAGSGLAIGAGIGTAIGVATNQIALWLSIGIGVGLLIGAATGLSSRPPR
jgi:hypothetical protein